ncbi:OCIA domain-containing protein 1 [Willisornis vidua]|uniref:OCIA domain-containing protein 1 n=1 Tax=Willisornis vidua TaxID=1566151 RepID=A0ABQ9CWF7_9PASS|nr:OCIA domain-containing protein 1 [Willisornis vidua]
MLCLMPCRTWFALLAAQLSLNPNTQYSFQRAALQKWAPGKVMRFRRSKSKVLHLDQGNPSPEYTLGEELIENSPAEKDLGVLMGEVAGMCGYLAGKISYLPICSEKFKKLKDSPIGDVLRQAQRHSSPNRSSRKSEFSDTPFQSFTESSSPRAEFPPSSSYSDDYSSTDRALSSYEPIPFSASLNESSPTGITDYTVEEPAPIPEEGRKKKGITYEELRNKHRETYDVMLPPKAETPNKFSQAKPAKEGNKLIYRNT